MVVRPGQRCDIAEIAVADVGRRVAEVRVVRGVQSFSPGCSRKRSVNANVRKIPKSTSKNPGPRTLFQPALQTWPRSLVRTRWCPKYLPLCSPRCAGDADAADNCHQWGNLVRYLSASPASRLGAVPCTTPERIAAHDAHSPVDLKASENLAGPAITSPSCWPLPGQIIHRITLEIVRSVSTRLGTSVLLFVGMYWILGFASLSA